VIGDAAAPSPDVSVVVCTRNRRAWLEQCVRSVLSQEGVTWELLLVDDASTDGTREWLQGLKDPAVRVFLLEERSLRARAANLALADARGKYVMFLDDDDWLWAGALRVLVAGLDSHPDAVAAVGGRSVWFVEEDYERRDAHPRRPRVRDVFREVLFGWSAVSGQNLYRTSVVNQVGGYSDGLSPCDDRDLWLRVAALGKVVLRPETVMTYRVHSAQWRPANLRQVRERVARQAIRRMPAQKRRQGLLLRRSNALLDRAEDALSDGRYGAGLVAAVQAVATAPAIYRSPLIGEWVLRRLAGRVARRWFPARRISPDADRPRR
jgi:glycosyltransferase involved in cell wall biosynthesis